MFKKKNGCKVNLLVARDKFCVGKQQIGLSLTTFYFKSLYRHMVLLLDIENTI